jgi:hypothetical protein
MLYRRFKIALASAGLKQSDWARKHKISEPGLSQLLRGKMKSKKHMASVTKFIESEFKRLNLTDGNRGSAAA